MTPRRALVRPPGKTYASALTRLASPPPIELNLAREQHAGYVIALRECGVDVTVLPPDGAHPDAVFVRDRLLVLDGQVIVCPSAVESRRGEDESLIVRLRQGRLVRYAITALGQQWRRRLDTSLNERTGSSIA